MIEAGDLAGETTELLVQLIRNACVNDGTPASGSEVRSADVLRTVLKGTGLDLEVYEPMPGRTSLLTRIEGTDPTAPTLLLMGHTDVVPVTPDHWREDPFGGEIIDGEVWGRGAVDMLNLTASMAVAVKHLATAPGGWRPRGTLLYLAVADEEAMGNHGAKWLTEHELEHVRADYVLTESGGIPVPGGSGIKRPVIVGEKGSYWCTLRIQGTPGHASQPLLTDNALVKAAEVVRRIDAYRPEAQIHDVWRRFVEGMDMGPEMSELFLTADGFRGMVEALGMIGLARQAHACTHTTFAPTVLRAGTKVNVIPDMVELDVDIRTLPGQLGTDAVTMLNEALGDLADSVEITPFNDDESTQSPIDTPLWDTLQRATSVLAPGDVCIPFLTVGGTDARFYRRLGATAYGYGMFSPKVSMDEFGAMFHGNDERIDIASLDLSARLWMLVAQDLLA